MIKKVHGIDFMCQEKKEKKDSPALKIAWIHQYKDSKTKFKKKQRKTNYQQGQKK